MTQYWYYDGNLLQSSVSYASDPATCHRDHRLKFAFGSDTDTAGILHLKFAETSLKPAGIRVEYRLVTLWYARHDH
jgi:hypothetical protein